MPGKYSYGLVLAQYSSQGIINLPNDGYLRGSAPPRAASAAASRQRATSNFTDSSERQALTSHSVPSLRRIAHSRPNFTTFTETPGTHQRLLIIASDSEDEADIEEKAESEDEWVRPHARPGPRSAQNMKPNSSRSSPPTRSHSQQPVFTQDRANNSETQQMPEETSRTPNAQKDLTVSKSPRKRSRGVKALIQARHETEMKNSATTNRGLVTEDVGLSLREFLQAGRQSGGHKERQMTVQQFLATVPSPISEELESTGTSDPPFHSGTRSTGKAEPVKSNGVSAYQLQTQKNFEGADRPSTSLQYNGESVENSKSRFFAPRAKTQSAVRTPGTEHQRSPGPINQDLPAITVSNTHLSGQMPHTFDAHPRTHLVSQSRSAPRPRSRATNALSSHRRAKSSLSSFNSSNSSIFGMSSIGAATQATSGQSPSSRKTSKLECNRRSDLLLSQQDQQHDAFTEMFQDINNTTTLFTSDEEEDNDEAADMRTPRLQSIPESELFSGGQWGTISTGHNTIDRVRDADEMSDMSAVFPPDIGRYRYDGNGEGALAMAPSGMGEEGNQPERLNTFWSTQKKNGSQVGLLRKLKKKALR